MTRSCSSVAVLRLVFAILGSLCCLSRLVDCHSNVAFSSAYHHHHRYYTHRRHRAQQQQQHDVVSRRTVALRPQASRAKHDNPRYLQGTDDEEAVQNLTDDSTNNKQLDGMTMISIASVLVGLVWGIISWNQFPVHEFDIDAFIALKGIMAGGSPENASAILDGDEAMTIRELPALSPAEQLVGAFFGPPSK